MGEMETDEFGIEAGVPSECQGAVGGDQEDTDEDLEQDKSHVKFRPGGARDIMISIALNVLCYTRNQQVNAFQGIFTYFHFASNTSKRAMDVNQKLGLGVAYETIGRLLRHNAEAAKQSYMSKAHDNPFVLFYDNMNFISNVKTTLLSNHSNIKNYTAVYMYFTSKESWKKIIGSQAQDVATRFLPRSWINRKIGDFGVKDVLVSCPRG